MLGVLHPLDRGLDGVDPRLDPPRGDHLPRRLGLGRQPLAAALVEGAALEGRLRVRAGVASCAAPTRPPGTIKSGGKTRRAAKMVVLDVDHPDVEEFIWCKAKEERKARVLEQAGYDMSLDSPDWASIQYQNANNSVRVTDAFMEAAVEGKEWNLTARTDGTVLETTRRADAAARRWRQAAWECADPGVQYDTTINSWHTLPNTGRINASNPCSEYMSIDDSACNLASLNLMKFRREDGELDVEAFEHAVDVDASSRRRSSSATRRTRRPRSAGTRSPTASSASATRTSARC